MKTNSIATIGDKVITEIKKKFKENENCHYINISYFQHTSNGKTQYGLCFNNSYKEIGGFVESLYYLETLSRYISLNLKIGKKSNIVTPVLTKIYIDWRTSYDVLDGITIVTPCKEFSKLQNYIEKYSNVKLNPNKLFNIETSGKRGRYFDDYDSINYFSENPKWCDNTLDKIKKSKGSKDILSISPYQDKYEEDKRHSEYYETECSGSRIETYKVNISTPTGKLKNIIVL